MGLKGNLSSTSLAEVFQTLSTGSSTGLLRIQAPEGPRFVEMKNGVISIAGRSAGRVMLGDLLISRGLIDDTRLDEALRLQKETGKMLGEVLLESGALTIEQLENSLRFQIEEEVCELFTLKTGDFDFMDGAGLDSRMAPAGGLVRVNLDLNNLLEEAGRRAEEWTVLEQRIPSQSLLFDTTGQGDELLKGTDGLSPEGMILLRLVKTHRTVEAMVQKACLGRFTTNRMLLELWDAGIVVPSPLKIYERVAKEHLRLNRQEEAQRVADFLLEFGNDEEKQQGKALLQDVAKMRQPPSPTSSTYVRADPKVRSEVIRRNQPGLILKKEKSYLPVIIVFVLLVGGVGAGAYFLYFTGKTNEATKSLKQLEQIADAANAYIVDGKYRDGLQLLREFRSFDPAVQKQANDLFDKRQRDVEAKLIQSIEKYDEVKRSGTPEDFEKAAADLQPLLEISVVDPNLEKIRAKARTEFSRRRDQKRIAQFEEKVKQIESTEKAKGGEALLKAYESLLADDPPEVMALSIRDAVLQLRVAQSEARALAAQARASKDAGDLEMARTLFDRARQRFSGSSLTAEADKAVTELGETLTASQAQFDKAQLLVTQNKTDDARAALLKYIEGQPPQNLRVRALMALNGLPAAPETELIAAYKAATALWDKQPDEARKKIIELVEKNPYSNMAAQAILKVKISTIPEGTTLQLNGKAAGTTPATIDVPALGLVRLSASREGFQGEEIIKNNLRDESISIALERTRVTSALLPMPASGGMGVHLEQLIAAGEREVVICSRTDLKATSRITFPGAAKEKSGTMLPLAVWRGEAFIPRAGEKLLFRLTLADGGLLQIDLDQPAVSTPVSFANPESGAHLMGVATGLGFESYDDEKGKSQKRVRLGDAGPLGIASAGEIFFLPRKGGTLIAINAIDGLKKWDGNAGGEIGGSPDYLPTAKIVAVVNAAGRVTAFDRTDGSEKWKQELGAECSFGLRALGNGFFVPAKGGKIFLLAGDTGKPAWSASVSGEPELAPLVVRTAGKDYGVALCTREGSGNEVRHHLNLISVETGALLWRRTLDSAPVSITADEQRVIICTADAVLSTFGIQ